jgi:hypothetical protein
VPAGDRRPAALARLRAGREAPGSVAPRSRMPRVCLPRAAPAPARRPWQRTAAAGDTGEVPRRVLVLDDYGRNSVACRACEGRRAAGRPGRVGLGRRSRSGARWGRAPGGPPPGVDGVGALPPPGGRTPPGGRRPGHPRWRGGAGPRAVPPPSHAAGRPGRAAESVPGTGRDGAAEWRLRRRLTRTPHICMLRSPACPARHIDDQRRSTRLARSE